MGLFSWASRKKRISQAAEQLWEALKTGVSFEVGAVFSTESETAEAVMILRKRHPEVNLTLQSRGWVLSLGKTTAVSDSAWQQLAKGGYLPSNELPKELFYAQHAAFINRNDNTVESAQRRALEEDRERNRIELTDRAPSPAPEEVKLEIKGK